jgi:hypothetical protein
MPGGKPKKEFHEYLCEATNSHVSHKDYLASPATTFLKYTIEAKSAIDLCIRKFPKKKNGQFTSDSLDSLQHLEIAILPAIMGHFETYQKSLFAGMFDLTVYSTTFKLERFIEKLNNGEVKIDLTLLSAYRNIEIFSVGHIVADSLNGWHSPEKVNKHFEAFGFNYQFYSADDIKILKVLWQLRHSIVHTGGTLTLPDAQKVKNLNSFGNRNIAFEKNFIYEVSRKFHPIIKRSTEGIGQAFKNTLLPNLPNDTIKRIDTFFKVKSSIHAWLK